MRTAAATKKNKNTRPFDPHKRKVTRANIVMPDDNRKTAEDLQKEIDKAGPTEAAAAPLRRTVARKDIQVAEQVFQWRGSAEHGQWDRKNHIYMLAKAISDNEKPLDRLLVLRVGSSYCVIDGHHRLAAYDTAGWTKDIPVEVFTGTLTEARVRALECNVKDKLAMTPQAKSEAAWRITKENLGGLTGQQVADKTGVSLRTVRNMRRVWRELNERNDKAPMGKRVDLTKLTWKQACAMLNGETLDDEDFDANNWKRQKAQKVIDLMQKHNVTAGLLADVQITALVLEMLSERLPAALIETWAHKHFELIHEIVEDMPEELPF
jgi:hypothetical protein